MSEVGQLVMWATLFGLVLLARLLMTRPAQRLLGPLFRRLRDWAAARWERPEEVDPEAEELAIFLRRQRLNAHLERVRRILRDDEWMSATRQVGNRLAYASLVAELARTPEVYAVPLASAAPTTVAYDHRHRSSVEILDVVGWR